MRGKLIDLIFVVLSCVLIYGMNRYINRTVIKTSIIKHDVVTTFDSSKPSDISEVVVKGQDGHIVTNMTTGEVVQVKEMVSEHVVVGTGPESSYVGKLTGYGPDCLGCSGVLACPDSKGKYHYLTDDIDSTLFYDLEYGKVSILATDHTLFPCGTIMHVRNNNLDIYGVVMDTGVAMRDAWRIYGNVLIDLAFTSERAAINITNSNTSFTVLRWGW